ncbi:MAG: gluconate 2-dehydrogenase subunit 3 family protein [Acidobacteria bacterium]|nr:gluconate 2-dehydrogenase subunit 3 family protein [Acidobacteriota bacterium]
MNRRDAFKAIALGSAGLVREASVADPVAAEVHSHPHKKFSSPKTPRWRPRFFSEAQNETVTVIAELIIPETDTPGARAAKVNEHMDLVLSEENTEVQQRFLKGLDWIDRKSRQLFEADFRQTSVAQQMSILTALATTGSVPAEDQVGRQFFEDIKRRTTFAYYTSEVGIHQELKYKGNAVLSEWPGCPHPGHHGDSGD